MPTRLSSQERTNGVGNFPCMSFQGEMAGVEKLDDGVGIVALLHEARKKVVGDHQHAEQQHTFVNEAAEASPQAGGDEVLGRSRVARA